jgi:hypothetical protein
MRLALHIFRKDLERLWPVVLVTFALLGLFVYYDANHPMYVWRATFPQGTWLNLVLPFAWCFLAAQAILQDSLVGDKQFWVALPCNWRTLLIAKVTFIASTIALPYLVATSAILLARGFNPFQYVPQLFWKQLLLLAVLIPAAALATLARNIGQFLLAEIAVLSVLMFLGNPASQDSTGFTFFPWDVRWALALTILVVGGVIVVAGQFIARRTLVSRMLAVAAVICAAALYNEMSRDTSAAIRASFQAAPETRGKLSVRFSPEGNFRAADAAYTPNRTTVLIPLKFSGTFDRLTRFQIISLTMTPPDGGRYEAGWPGSSNAVRVQRISAFLQEPSPYGDAWLNLQIFNDAVVRRLVSGPLALSVRFLAESYQPGPPTPLRQSSWINAPEVGRCVLDRSEDPRRPGERGVITAECESPNLGATEMGVTGPRPGLGALLLRDLPSLTPGGLGADAWLSPIHRGAQILFPNYARADARWSVTALHAQGAATVDFTVPNLNLADYVLHDPKAGVAK